MNIEETVIKIVTDELRLKDDVVTLDSNLVDDLGTDSLDVVSILMALETEYKIRLDDGLYNRVHTVQDLINEVKLLV